MNSREREAREALQREIDKAVGRAARGPFRLSVIVEDGPDGKRAVETTTDTRHGVDTKAP